MNDKAQFYWAVIGDANPEPVAVVVEGGKRVAYTIGCNDPFDLDSGDIELIPPAAGAYSGMRTLSSDQAEPLIIPMKPGERAAERAEAEKRLLAAQKRGVMHSWRRLNP